MGNEHWAKTSLQNTCSITTGKRDVNEGNPNGKYLFFTCAQLPTKIDFYEFEGEAILVAGNGFFNVKHYIGKFNAYQRTYVLQDINIIPRFIFAYLIHSLDLLTKDQRGTTVKYIRLPNLQSHFVPLPPLPEQKRIVGKLDTILPKVKNAKSKLDKIPQVLKRFRQSVLAAACSGRLTDDWREKHIYDAPNIYEPIDASLHDIPICWKWTELGNLCNGFQYGTSTKSEKSGNVPVLRMGNLQNGLIDWSDLKYTNNKNDIKQYSLTTGDVLFNRTNSPDLVGKTSIYRGERPAIFAGYLIKIKNKNSLLLSKYLNICLNASYAREWCNHVKTDGVSQSNINAKVLATFSIPLASVEEQHEIVRRVEKLFKLADSLEAKYKKAMELVEKIEQSVLAKAFRGELAPQDPNDEPAEELLKRILAEKAKLQPAKRNSKRNARAKPSV